MTFSDTEIMELGRNHATNIHNTRLLIRRLKYVLDILQTEETFTVEEYNHTLTHAHTHPHTHTHTLAISEINLRASITYHFIIQNRFLYPQHPSKCPILY